MSEGSSKQDMETQTDSFLCSYCPKYNETYGKILEEQLEKCKGACSEMIKWIEALECFKCQTCIKAEESDPLLKDTVYSNTSTIRYKTIPYSRIMLQATQVEKINVVEVVYDPNFDKDLRAFIDNLSRIQRHPMETYIQIGPYGTEIPTKYHEAFDWRFPQQCLNTLMELIFRRDNLAFKSLMDNLPPTFNYADILYKQLNPCKLYDIMNYMTIYCQIDVGYVRDMIACRCLEEADKKRGKRKQACSHQYEMKKFMKQN